MKTPEEIAVEAAKALKAAAEKLGVTGADMAPHFPFMANLIEEFESRKDEESRGKKP